MPDVLHSVVDSRVTKRPLTRTERRKDLGRRTRLWNCEMPIPCTRCRHNKRRCFVGPHSGKCAECLKRGRDDCDMGVTQHEWSKIDRAKEKLQEELSQVELDISEIDVERSARVATRLRLRKQLGLLSQREKEMFQKELALLDQLDELEEKQKAEAERSASAATMEASSGAKGSNVVIEENVADQGDTDIIFSPSERFPSGTLSPVSSGTGRAIEALNSFCAGGNSSAFLDS